MANLKDMKTEDILKEVMEKREALRAFRFGEAGTRTRDVREGRTLRKDIARLLTEVRARSIASQRSKE